MPAKWEMLLERWVGAGLIDAATAERISAFESQKEKGAGLRWPVLIAISFGGLLLGAGVLLFVAAHWDELSPSSRFSVVLFTVAAFHAAGALIANRFSAIATTLHAIGTISLGAGIFLAGQIFNLQEHWPGGLMLWAMGAGLGWALLRDWVQATLVALLTPAWLAGEWIAAAEFDPAGHLILMEGLLLLALTYLSARTATLDSPIRRALVWIGAIALIPSVIGVATATRLGFWTPRGLGAMTLIAGWCVAITLPVVLAYFLRGVLARWNLIAAVWVVVLGTTGSDVTTSRLWHDLGPYIGCVVGSMALIAWGLLEKRSERINLGIAGFALTVMIFYFSNVMDKLDRAASLIGLGVLFLAGGWLLERTRRNLVARLSTKSV